LSAKTQSEKTQEKAQAKEKRGSKAKEKRESKAKEAQLRTSADKIMKPYRAPCRRIVSRDTFIRQRAAQRE
jgi:hypothetical protein